MGFEIEASLPYFYVPTCDTRWEEANASMSMHTPFRIVSISVHPDYARYVCSHTTTYQP